jgi:hypothetical protein
MSITSRVAPDEEARIADVRGRLRRRFPTLPAHSIDRAVDDAHRDLDGATVRDFVPILVERQALDLLAAQLGPDQELVRVHRGRDAGS